MVDSPSSIILPTYLPHSDPSNFHNFDILSHIFSCLDPYNKADRAACVIASRVCREWNVPASTAIWDARPRWDLLDLYHILFPHTPPLNSAGLVDSKKMREYLTALFYQGKGPPYDPVAWASFLRCCGRTRELYVPRLETSEALALGLILKWNEEDILFPSLRSLTWMESPRVAGLLPFLAPPSLRQLKLNFNPRGDIRPAEIGYTLSQLATASPAIQKMDIVNGHQTGPFPGDSLRQHSSLRRVTLGGKMALSLPQLRDILSLPHLEDLTSDLDTDLPADALLDAPTELVVAPRLKKLHCGGTCNALTTLFADLDAPSLRELEVFTDEPRWEHHFDGHRDLVQAISGSAPNLRFLRYRSFKDAQLLAERVKERFPVQDDWTRFAVSMAARPFWDILRPLFPSPRGLQASRHSFDSLYCAIERLVFEIWSPTELSSGDFERVQTAFAGFKGSSQWGETLATTDPDERRIFYTLRCTFELERT